MPTNTLTDAQCRAAKPADKPFKLFDGGGLHLWISTAGAKVWRLAYRVDGKPKTMSFGPYPTITLVAARKKRDEAKENLVEGKDPMTPRRIRKSSMTLSDASDKYWSGRKDLTDAYRSNALRGIEMHLGPNLGKREISSITREDLLAELQIMDAKGLHVYVRKVRMWVAQVFD